MLATEAGLTGELNFIGDGCLGSDTGFFVGDAMALLFDDAVAWAKLKDFLCDDAPGVIG